MHPYKLLLFYYLLFPRGAQFRESAVDSSAKLKSSWVAMRSASAWHEIRGKQGTSVQLLRWIPAAFLRLFSGVQSLTSRKRFVRRRRNGPFRNSLIRWQSRECVAVAGWYFVFLCAWILLSLQDPVVGRYLFPGLCNLGCAGITPPLEDLNKISWWVKATNVVYLNLSSFVREFAAWTSQA